MISPFILFIIILSILVFIHELGHFVTARKFGVKVEEFGLGIPPRAWGKKIGDTLYSLNWLPLGGFVKIHGEDFDGYNPDDKTNFMNKKPWQQAVVLSAGVFMNFVLAVAIFYFILGVNGWKSNPVLLITDYEFPYGKSVVDKNVVTFVAESSASKDAGIKFGDKVLKLAVGNTESEIKNAGDIREFIKGKEGQEIVIDVHNIIDGEVREHTVIPTYSENLEQAALGVGLGEAVSIDYSENKYMSGFTHSVNSISYSYFALKSLVSQSIEDKDPGLVSQGVAGPVGIFSLVKTTMEMGGKKAATSLLELSALMSLSFAIMNLLPIPALDGGRLVFVGMEILTGKRPSAKLEEKAHRIGYMFLILLIILISIKDFFTFF